MRGRKPDPTYLKVIKGNPGRRPLNKREPKPKPVKRLRRPPAMGPIAYAAFKRLTKALRDLGILNTADRDAMEGYCAAYEQMRIAKRRILTEGQTFVTEKGYEVQRPEVAIVKHNLNIMRQYLVEFGLTPSARTKVKTEPAEEGDDLLD